MNYTVKITEAAEADIAEIVDYISKTLFAPTSARAWLSKLKHEIASLDTMPLRYALVPEEPWHAEGIRNLLVDNFFVYYWVDESKQLVWITSVIYTRRDQLSALRNMPKA